MSVSMRWRPRGEGRSFKSGYTSEARRMLEETVGFELDERAIPILRAMATANSSYKDFFNEIADKIEEVGEIEILSSW